MKRILTMVFAAMALMTMWGQTNLALNQPSIATSATAGRPASAGNDGDDNGTRWESASADPQQWQVDLGEAQDFNTIVITWEGAYGKTFEILGGNTVGDDGFITDGVVLTSIEGQTLSGFPYVQRLTLPQTANYRYVQFKGIERGTGWGYSFFEFGVYNIVGDPVLTTLKLTASGTQVEIGQSLNLTLAASDELGAPYTVNNVQYVLSNPSVGTVANDVFTGTAVGETTIKAVSGNVESNAVAVNVVGGQKIDLFTDWLYRIYNLGLATSTSKVGAFDANPGSLWDLLGKTTANDEASRTYDVGFIADLRGIYDLSSIAIHFEGACSEEFTLAFAGEDGVFGETVLTGGTHVADVNNHTETFDCSAFTDVRYVKFLSTKAATIYGVKIFDFSVIGTLVNAVTDTEAPVITSATADADAATETSVTLNINASDNSSKYVAYSINNVIYALGTCVAGTNAPIVINDLNGGTSYEFTVIAIDAFNNRSEAVTVTAQTTGEVFILTAAPAPTHVAANVVSIYSNAYEPATAHWIGGWGQTTQTAFETVDGDEMYVFTNFNYLGFEYTTDVDLAGMEYLHVDVLPMQPMNLGVTPIMRAGAGATEQSTLVGDLTPRQWNSIDLPLSAFTNIDFNAGVKSFQFKFDRGTASEKLYIDNLYFWKNASTEPVLGDVTGDGKVDVSDVNAVINMMLGKATMDLNADLNNDGKVDVSDVNAIINIMLGKTIN